MIGRVLGKRPGEHVAIRVARSIAMTLVVLVVVAFGIKACVATFLITCWNDETNAVSPDNRHIARRLVRVCEGPLAINVNITQTVEIAGAGGDSPIKIFESYEDAGSLHWNDDDHLSIEIDAVSTITLSAHQADGIQIVYHVPRKALDLSSEDDAEGQEAQLHQASRLTDADYESEKKTGRFLRQWHEDFIRWATANAVIDDAAN